MRPSREINNGGKLTMKLRLTRRLKELGWERSVKEQTEVPGF